MQKSILTNVLIDHLEMKKRKNSKNEAKEQIN